MLWCPPVANVTGEREEDALGLEELAVGTHHGLHRGRTRLVGTDVKNQMFSRLNRHGVTLMATGRSSEDCE